MSIDDASPGGAPYLLDELLNLDAHARLSFRLNDLSGLGRLYPSRQDVKQHILGAGETHTLRVGGLHKFDEVFGKPKRQLVPQSIRGPAIWALVDSRDNHGEEGHG
jgi:hypothetical protein